MKKTCETCAGYLPVYEGGIGECRFYPPIICVDEFIPRPLSIVTEISHSTRFPEVTSEEWCCQWRKKEDEEHAD